ncbi:MULTISPECIES: dTMP kinase [unclassified Mesorhizobium]|uniref:dTMP kinase n=1 Tax=unclassified Mesorhizobium TaxID=325217 RepID=UPI0003CF3FAD|nr:MULTISPECIES: dTMP kinase [unclassified Mesorhizobium]ESX84371.1 thymidylate kinase [Mesorhizobium sp. LSHC412B00]ESY02836.1 thymidylate kinase [Mesorhizobium sp. LNJC398B00]
MPFVSIEGIDGSGKSLQVEYLTASLLAMDLQVVKTKEPDGGWIGAGVRSILVEPRPSRLSPLEEMLLISAARVDHVRSVIRPALDAGAWVVSDRFLDSTYAFQVYGSDVPEQLFTQVAEVVVGGTMPDLTFVLDIDPAAALERRSARGGSGGPDPSEATRDFARIREGLLTAAKRDPGRCHVLDAAQMPGKVSERILSVVLRAGLVDAGRHGRYGL